MTWTKAEIDEYLIREAISQLTPEQAQRSLDYRETRPWCLDGSIVSHDDRL